jgi:hypothetical protein
MNRVRFFNDFARAVRHYCSVKIIVDKNKKQIYYHSYQVQPLSKIQINITIARVVVTEKNKL